MTKVEGEHNSILEDKTEDTVVCEEDSDGDAVTFIVEEKRHFKYPIKTDSEDKTSLKLIRRVN